MIVVATTLCAFAMDDRDTWGAWLRNAEAIRESHPDGVTFFAAIEVDGRGIGPFSPLIDRLQQLGGEWWEYTLDDGRTSVTTANRLRHITMGQNLATDYACSVGALHMLFMAADCEPPADAIPKLAGLNWPIVGGHVPTYCLDGPREEASMTGTRLDVPVPAGADVRRHMASAAFIMLRRDLFTKLRWRWDIDAGMSDDPCMHHDALTLLGIPTYVRHDVVGRHYPECIGAVETRGHDLSVQRLGG